MTHYSGDFEQAHAVSIGFNLNNFLESYALAEWKENMHNVIQDDQFELMLIFGVWHFYQSPRW